MGASVAYHCAPELQVFIDNQDGFHEQVPFKEIKAEKIVIMCPCSYILVAYTDLTIIAARMQMIRDRIEANVDLMNIIEM